MKRLFLVLLIFAVAGHVGCLAGAAWAEAAEALKTAVDAYIFAYPLVLMDVARLYVEKRAGAEDNVFFRGRTFAEADSACLQNSNVFVSGAWLDLSEAPVILHLPANGCRSYSAQLIDGWTNPISVFGTDATPREARDFAVVGPSWHGHLPSGITIIDSPTDMALILVRLPSPDVSTRLPQHWLCKTG